MFPHWLVTRGLINGKCFRRPAWPANCFIKFSDNKLQAIGAPDVSRTEVEIRPQPYTYQDLVSWLEIMLWHEDYMAEDWQVYIVPT
ncbi:MAG TPA: hypothetical protein VNX68_17045 [Nitrosopumilaceae archaeon]|jgi:hypothetical protein|nr:hypothetical protein [Nitrosopumilaceae archaeon]